VGCRWLDGLPDLVTGLERDWGIAVGDLLPGGSAGLVVRAINAAGEAVLRKLGSPAHDNFANQVAVEVLAREVLGEVVRAAPAGVTSARSQVSTTLFTMSTVPQLSSQAPTN